MDSTKKEKKSRLYHLDLIRFFAALYVVLYHYGYRGYAKDNFSILRFPELESFSKYGYLGVDLFFIISGFVILLSVRKSSFMDFMISRITRLYPAYWFCVILTALVIYFFDGNLFKVTLPQVLFNLTMLNGFFGVEYVDGVYWSLLIELKFYILIGLILLFRLMKHIKLFAYILLFFAIAQLIVPFKDAPILLKIIYYVTFAKYSAYFVAGMFFYLIKTGKRSIFNIIPILISYVVAILYAVGKVQDRNLRYDNSYDENVVAILITVFFILMFLISYGKLLFLNKRIFYYFGILTYPLYLIHQNIGFIIFNTLGKSMNKWLLLSIVMILMIYVSYLIHKFIEKPLSRSIRNKLTNSKLLNTIRLRTEPTKLGVKN
jgi:peptidoglycan/LPS O-acetylase OafA/YrhL